MPSLKSKQRLNQLICLGVSTLLLGTALVGCGSGESEAKNTTTPTVTEPKPKNFKIKVPVEMRDVTIKVYDNFDNTLVLEKDITTTTDLQITLPKVLNTSHLYRVEINTSPNSLIYNFLTNKYENVSTVLHSIVNVDVSNLTQTIFINPSSEAIYQRALIRSGQLPNESETSTDISTLHLKLAADDINSALLNAYTRLDIPNLASSYQLSSFTNQDVQLKPSLYVNTFFSLGYIQQWANNYPDAPYIDFIKNLSIDLKDGYLDAKKINGDKTDLISLLEPSPNNIDPEKNNAKDIGDNQKNIRTEFGSSLKDSVLKLATNFQQQTINPNGYKLLQQYTYVGTEPIYNTTLNVRTAGAGDYRRAVGFVDTTATCNGSIYPCKQGITGINIVNPNLPSIEYLIGHYEDAANNCQLNIRANGVLELIKGSQIYRSVLDADSTDNLLQVDKANREYLLNSSSTEPNNTSLDYSFVQVKIKENQVQSASAGLDSRKAPDQLQTTQLQCNFS
ncbi:MULTISPECIES: hypothetical protein [Acinetobacter]|jgi:hypothetical protein|uniref:hypothetical protein n=1 Tax=Acinetobacter TaxID=469 RepID=UPI000C693C55|nr:MULTISPECIES: hypothetical protein [Acinetobacter]MBC70621.1 hypothetical protein [Acinetobacter sp.]MBT49858.1 hypothetical protein [Acinetobacter sp.]HIQ33404.1 hypothetical protein [Acinetobacter venetianus]HJP48479.1 hypothetical protein [Acinetobacter venetianus]|tara:strand:+ start:915 stop:2432 length:1518 start_codon:yes stop_codon:yes gene_type:complete